MGLEQFGGRLTELVDVRARRVEGGKQRQGVLAHRSFDQKWLMQLRFPQFGFDLGGGLGDAAAAASTSQRSGDPVQREFGGRSRGRRDRQYGAGLGAGDPQREPAGECRQERRVELAQCDRN
jgi:hypothetical protein